MFMALPTEKFKFWVGFSAPAEQLPMLQGSRGPRRATNTNDGS